jgi:hypothetical protein
VLSSCKSPHIEKIKTKKQTKTKQKKNKKKRRGYRILRAEGNLVLVLLVYKKESERNGNKNKSAHERIGEDRGGVRGVGGRGVRRDGGFGGGRPVLGLGWGYLSTG